ncbi:MAG: hypothetical protein Q9174_002904, partial [Haloplaca sp. 1 TL-2023]
MHAPNGTAITGSTPVDINSPVDPASHYFYFFDNNPDVAVFVADIFTNLISCTDGKQPCGNNQILCPGNPESGGGMFLPTCDYGAYGYVADPNQRGAALNNRPREDGQTVFLCDNGLDLTPASTPCADPVTGAESPGYALLYEMVQIDIITRPDLVYLEEKTGWQNITQLRGPEAFKEPLADIG